MKTSDVVRLPELEHAKYALEHAEWDVKSSDENDPLVEASIAQAAALIALVEEQRRTNELLSAALGLAIHVIRYGDTMGMGDALDSFTVHPRDPSLEVG